MAAEDQVSVQLPSSTMFVYAATTYQGAGEAAGTLGNPDAILSQAGQLSNTAWSLHHAEESRGFLMQPHTGQQQAGAKLHTGTATGYGHLQKSF